MSWSRKTLPKKLTKIEPEIKTYYLTPEELEHYRSLPKPINEKNISTTAKRSFSYNTRK